MSKINPGNLLPRIASSINSFQKTRHLYLILIFVTGNGNNQKNLQGNF